MNANMLMTRVDHLPVMESFLTIQGEGHHVGKPAYFIRLGGCDVGCVWCDVKESWEAEDHPLESVDSLVNKVVESGVEIVVVTGGEPFMYDLSQLTKSLKEKGLKVHVETAGVYPITGKWDWICFSPKKFKQPLEEYFRQADELKVIIFNKSDLKWAETHVEQLKNTQTHLFLQPEWSKQNEMTPLIIEYIKSNPKWRVSLQTHKFMDIP